MNTNATNIDLTPPASPAAKRWRAGPTLSWKERGVLACALVLLCFSAFVTPVIAISPSIVISEIQITGGTGKTGRDFVELYNPTDTPFNLKGYRLVKRTKTGTTDTSLKSFSTDTMIPAKGYFLWVSSDDEEWAATMNAGASTSQTLASDNGVALRFGPENDGIIIDAVAWGATTNAFVETSPFPTNPSGGQSIERINNLDTDRNAADFALQSAPTPTHTAASDTTTTPSSSTSTSTTESTTTTPTASETTTSSTANDAPSSTTTAVPDPVLRLNEIFPNPVGSDVSEFIEIKNAHLVPLELKGWTIANKRGQSFTFDYRTLSTEEVLALPRSQTEIILQNDSETVTLTAPGDTKPYATATIKKAPEGQSLMWDGGDWKWTTVPTPGGNNKFVPPSKPPVLIATIPKKATVDEILLFDASDTYDPEGLPFTIAWDFGDGSETYKGPDATYIYAQPRTYTVTLSAINAKGMLVIKKMEIKVTETLKHESTEAQGYTKTSAPDPPPARGGERGGGSEQEELTVTTKAEIKSSTTTPSLPTGVLEGVITVPPGVLGTTFGYIECLSPCAGQGIKIRMTKADWPPLVKGDIIRLSGTWSKTGGETSFLTRASFIAKTPRQQRVTPTSMTLSKLTDTELNRLIRLEGEVTQKTNSYSYLDDGTDEIEVEIKNAAHRRVIAEGDRIRIAGVLTKKEDGRYRLRATEEPEIVSALPKDPQREITIERKKEDDRAAYLATTIVALLAIAAKPLYEWYKKRAAPPSQGGVGGG